MYGPIVRAIDITNGIIVGNESNRYDKQKANVGWQGVDNIQQDREQMSSPEHETNKDAESEVASESEEMTIKAWASSNDLNPGEF